MHSDMEPAVRVVGKSILLAYDSQGIKFCLFSLTDNWLLLEII